MAAPGVVLAGPQPAPDVQRPTARDRPLYLVLFLAGLALNMFSGNSALIGMPVGPDRLLFAAGLLLFWHRERRGLPLRPTPLHFILLATVVWVFSSGLLAGTLGTRYGAFGLLDRIVVPFAFFLLAPALFRTPGRRMLLGQVLVVVGLYLSVTAILEMVGPHELVFPRYVMDPDVGIQYGRARGPFVESEADGLTMIACGAAAAFVAVRSRGAWRWLAAAVVLACGLGCLLTLTRSVWLGAVLGVVLAAAVSRRLRRWLPIALGVLALGVLLALQVVPGLHAGVSESSERSRSLQDRQNTNAAAVRIIEARPLSGVGWMRFVEVSQDWVRQSDDYPITNIHIEVHNVVLSRAAELGLPGAALWAASVVGCLGRAAVRRRSGDLEGWRGVFIATGAAWAVALMSSPVPYPMPTFLVWIFGGLLAAGPAQTASAVRGVAG